MSNIFFTVQDSWGGKEGFIPPLLGCRTTHNSETEDFLYLSEPEDDTTPLLKPRTTPNTETEDVIYLSEPEDDNSNSVPTEFSITDVPDVKEDAEYVNIHKLMNPSSSAYYSPQVNRDRRRLEQVRRKKDKDEFSLDESGHTKASLLEERSRRSAYKGPRPTKDGGVLKGIMKTGTRSTLSRENSMSIDTSINSSPMPGIVERDKPKTMRRCSFSFVDIREHERIAGDNPCVSSGVPLSIGWGYYQHAQIELDHYELNKGPPRDKVEMLVPAAIRRSMLRDEFSVPVAELNYAIREANVTKRRRRHTVATEHLEAWEDVIQSAKRKFNRIVKKTTTAKEQEKLWSKAHKNAMTEYLKTRGAGK